jgi:hypothetical protein
MRPEIFLLFNFALAFYNVGTIWAHELDIFRSWNLVGREDFHGVQRLHWGKLPYWVLVPVGVAWLGSIALIWYRPSNAPLWPLASGLVCQTASHILTALFWGPWQAKLSKDPLGPDSPYLSKILATHWIRTLLITANGAFFLAWSIQCFASR